MNARRRCAVVHAQHHAAKVRLAHTARFGIATRARAAHTPAHAASTVLLLFPPDLTCDATAHAGGSALQLRRRWHVGEYTAQARDATARCCASAGHASHALAEPSHRLRCRSSHARHACRRAAPTPRRCCSGSVTAAACAPLTLFARHFVALAPFGSCCSRCSAAARAGRAAWPRTRSWSGRQARRRERDEDDASHAE